MHTEGYLSLPCSAGSRLFFFSCIISCLAWLQDVLVRASTCKVVTQQPALRRASRDSSAACMKSPALWNTALLPTIVFPFLSFSFLFFRDRLLTCNGRASARVGRASSNFLSRFSVELCNSSMLCFAASRTGWWYIVMDRGSRWHAMGFVAVVVGRSVTCIPTVPTATVVLPSRDLTRTGTLHTIRLVVVESRRCGEGLVEGSTGMMGKTLGRKF
jgi:hypothetical protein